MFDNIDKKTKDNTLKHDRNINLLPEDLRFKETKKNKKPIFASKDGADFHFPKEDESMKDKKNKEFVKEKKIKPKKEKNKRSFSLRSFLAKLRPAKKASSIQFLNSSVRPVKSTNIKDEELKDKKNELHRNNFEVTKVKPLSSLPDNKFIKKDEEVKAEPRKGIKFHKVKEETNKQILKDGHFDVNLLPREDKFLSFQQAILSYCLALVFCSLAISLSFLFYKDKNSNYQTSNKALTEQSEMIQQRVNDAENTIDDYGPLAYKLKYINQLLDTHIYWSKFFPTLEASTIPTVFYSDLSVTAEQRITLSASALNLRSVAEQLVVMEGSDVYSNVDLDNLSLRDPGEEEDENYVGFGISFDLDPNIINFSD